jgi:hypothetical protein
MRKTNHSTIHEFMATNIPDNISDRESAEWQFLQSLCAATLPATLRQQYCEQAHTHNFADMANRIIFEELCAMTTPGHSRSPHEIRADLPARATRRGFPDLDFASLLSDDALTEQAAAQRVALAWQNLLTFS